MADKVTKICMDMYRKLEKNRVLSVTERLQIPNNLEICYLYNLQWKYVKKYISIQASIFLVVSSVLDNSTFSWSSYTTLPKAWFKKYLDISTLLFQWLSQGKNSNFITLQIRKIENISTSVGGKCVFLFYIVLFARSNLRGSKNISRTMCSLLTINVVFLRAEL
jgi:hypothetical protein